MRFAYLSVLAFFLAACGPRGPQEYAFQGRSMGTTYTVKIIAEHPLEEGRPDQVANVIFAAIEDVNGRMSTYKKDSELSRFNEQKTADPFPVSPETMSVLAEARRIGMLSGGAYDITVGPVVNAWGFGPGIRTEDLSPEMIAGLLESVGWDKIEINEESSTIRKLQPEVYIDLSSIAKGYGSDRVAAALEREGFSRYMIELGGEVHAAGLNLTGEPWRLGIERPVENERVIERVVPLTDLSMATSGDYRNFYDADGERISHTIDPRTGYPVRGRLASVSVVHASCMTADGWATALTAMGEEAGFALAEQERLPVLFQLRLEDGTFEEKPTAAFTEMFGQPTR